MISSVDYTSRFTIPHDGSSWVVDAELVDEFSSLYGRLKETGEVREGALSDVLNRIFVYLNGQATHELERRFLTELFEDLQLLVGHHIDFYSARTRNALPARGRAAQLCSEGFYITTISGRALDEIRGLAAPLLDVLRANARNGQLARTDLSVSSGRVIRRIVRALNREFATNGVLSDVEMLLRRRPRVVGLALELSVAGSSWWKLPTASSEWPKTLYAHVDRAVDAPKSIVYLTDVGPMNGPTSCYPSAYQQVDKNSLQDLVGRSLETIGRNPDSPLHDYYSLSGQPLQNERFRGHFMSLPAALRFNSHFGWDVEPRSQLEDFLVGSEFQVLGPAGTALVFDGAELLHRGGLIEEGERVVLQVVFGDPTLRQRAMRVIRFITTRLSWR